MAKLGQRSDDPDLISLFKALQPSTLYLITSKAVFLEGFKSYKENHLESFSWTANQRALKGILTHNTVTFTAKTKQLHYKCNCQRWTAAGHCEHIICSLLTILNLLFPKLFQLSGQDGFRLQILKAALFGSDARTKKKASPKTPSNKKDLIEVIIEIKGDYPSVYLTKGGTVVDSPIGLQEGLSDFTYRYYTDPSLRELFLKHLVRFGNSYPLILETRTGRIPLEWDEKLSYQGKTELNVSGQEIEIRALALLDGIACDHVERFWDFVVNPETGKLGRVRETAGWRLYDGLDRMFRSSASVFDDFDEFRESRQGSRNWLVRNVHFRIPLKTFQSIQFNIKKATQNETLNDLVLKVNNKVVSPVSSQHRHRLTIDPGEGEVATLRTECWLGDSEGVTTAHTFSFFSGIHSNVLPAACRAQKRLIVLYETFFHLSRLKKKAEADKVIRKALSTDDFTQHTVKKEARNFLKHYFLTFKDEDLRLHFSENTWLIVPNQKEKEALLYKIPFDCFGPKIFKEMTTYHEIPLPRNQLYAQLAQLYAQCKLEGIDLYHKGKPVKTVKWDFSFDARRPPGIDWFEIRPEIRSDGMLVDESVWMTLLQGNGVVEKEGAIQIVDANAQKIINALALIYTPRNTGTRDKKEIERVPRMQILDWVQLRKEGVQIKLSEEDEQLIKRLTQLEKINQITTPRHLLAKLRPYQKEGLDWLAFLYQNRLGAILSDDMGLGKTLQAISLLASLKEKIILPIAGYETDSDPIHPKTKGHSSPHLIIVPPTLLFNWEHELNRFYPKLKCYQYVGKDRLAEFSAYDVVLTTYALVRRDINILKKHPFHVIIFDEAQAVKNIYADTTSAVRQLKGLFKLVMTGTPLENHLGEYYSLIDLALPGLLGEYDDFKSQIKLEDSPLLQVLIRRTRPFVLRRLKDSVLKELPPKVESNIYLDLTHEQKVLYQQTVALISSKINNAYREKTSAQAKIIALTAILKLRQICISPRLLHPDADSDRNHSPKMTFLMNQLQELREEGHSALVFSQFTRSLDLLEAELRTVSFPFYRLDGSTPTKKREQLVKGFQEDGTPSVFLLSLKAGGQGLNLTKASYVFHLDPWWNPAVENQASDRAHRIGQLQKVSVTRILMRHTIEEKMMVLKKKKLALYDAVMGDPQKGGTAYTISKSDFDFLLED